MHTSFSGQAENGFGRRTDERIAPSSTEAVRGAGSGRHQECSVVTLPEPQNRAVPHVVTVQGPSRLPAPPHLPVATGGRYETPSFEKGRQDGRGAQQLRKLLVLNGAKPRPGNLSKPDASSGGTPPATTDEMETNVGPLIRRLRRGSITAFAAKILLIAVILLGWHSSSGRTGPTSDGVRRISRGHGPARGELPARRRQPTRPRVVAGCQGCLTELE